VVPYEVRTEVFEGPFDLLLHLVLRSQVDVYEVSLSAIVDVFVAELAHMQGSLDLEVATEFVLVAATLIELKTRGLLPGSGETEVDEELAIWEQRDLLLSRLLACKTFKDVAAALARLAAAAERSIPRRAGPDETLIGLSPDVLAGVTPEDLRAALLRALAPRPVPRVDLDHVAPIRASVADAVAELADELPRVGRITFRRLTQELVTRLEVIVRFLAVLELYKQGAVELVQHGTFGSIEIEWLGLGHDTMAGLVDAYDG
jgi:segregation and condensation protein A